MPSRFIPLVNNEFYHVLNRGTGQMQIFNQNRDYQRFFKTMLYYRIQGPKPRFSLFSPENTHLDQNRKIVEIICYCLMPNHFHLLLQQKIDGGITEFISKLSNSYTKYFNTKNRRSGPLLQGEFKAIHVETDEQLIHLSRYIHLNPLVSYITKSLEQYTWSSFSEYTKEKKSNFLSTDIILDQFKSTSDYQKFVKDQEGYGKKLEAIKHQLLDYSFPRVQTPITPGVK